MLRKDIYIYIIVMTCSSQKVGCPRKKRLWRCHCAKPKDRPFIIFQVSKMDRLIVVLFCKNPLPGTWNNMKQPLYWYNGCLVKQPFPMLRFEMYGCTYFSSSFSAQNAAANSPGLLAFIFADDDSYANLKDLPATKDPDFFERKILVVWDNRVKRPGPKKERMVFQAWFFRGEELVLGRVHSQSLLAGGFKYIFIFTPILGDMIQFEEHIFQLGWFNHQLVTYWVKRFKLCVQRFVWLSSSSSSSSSSVIDSTTIVVFFEIRMQFWFTYELINLATN